MKQAQVIVNLRQFLCNENYWARYAITQELQIFKDKKRGVSILVRGSGNRASVLLNWDPGSV